MKTLRAVALSIVAVLLTWVVLSRLTQSSLAWTLAILAIGVAYGVVDAALRPDSAWTRADQNKAIWTVVQLVAPGPGTVAYFLDVRPHLAANSHDEPQGTRLGTTE
jgi:cobalamin synthase